MRCLGCRITSAQQHHACDAPATTDMTAVFKQTTLPLSRSEQLSAWNSIRCTHPFDVTIDTMLSAAALACSSGLPKARTALHVTAASSANIITRPSRVMQSSAVSLHMSSVIITIGPREKVRTTCPSAADIKLQLPPTEAATMMPDRSCAHMHAIACCSCSVQSDTANICARL